MNVYAPSDSSVVLFTSSGTDKSTVRRLFERLVGALGVITLVGFITRGGLGLVNTLATLRGYGMDDGGHSTPPLNPPGAGIEVLSPEFLAL
jgi:hypothetical protein